MIKILFLISILFSFNAYTDCNSDPVRVAVVDTGFGYNGHGEGARLCKDGHQDFSEDQVFHDPTWKGLKIPKDFVSHGTNVTGVIEEYARKGNTNYCIMVLKYYNRNSMGLINVKNTVAAFNYAAANGAKYINYSGGGSDPFAPEKSAVLSFLDFGGIFVAAAGNDNDNLDLPWHHYYPAMYDKRIVVVGSIDKNGEKSSFSNYGSPVNRWELGRDVLGYGLKMSGTSQSTAVATGKLVGENPNKCESK